jgi:hypothetical protein
VDWRRLVDATHDRLEVVDAEDPGVEVAVPTDDVEWMVVEDQLVERVILLHEDPEIALLVVRAELDRPANIALAERRPFQQLPELVAVPLWPTHVPTTLKDEQLGLVRGSGIELPAVRDIPMDNYIIARYIGQVTVHGFEHP